MDTSTEEYDIGNYRCKVIFNHTADDTTCAVIATPVNRKKFHAHTFVGHAVRHPNEKDDPVMGAKVALRKALNIGDWWRSFYEIENKLWHEYRLTHHVGGWGDGLEYQKKIRSEWDDNDQLTKMKGEQQ